METQVFGETTAAYTPTDVPAADSPQPGSEYAPETSTLWTDETRRVHLESLPHYGFSDEQYFRSITDIVAVGLPVNNYASLHRRPNSNETDNWLGSWGIGTNYGQFSLYERLDLTTSEERIGTIAHEGLHSVTPLEKFNDHLYGGEAERRAAESLVWSVMFQSKATGIHLNGYHKMLMEKEAKGEIDQETLAEETHAIMGEMAMTNRYGLLEVQKRQRSRVEDLNRIRRINGQPEVEFTDIVTEEGASEVRGVDKTLIQLLKGVDTLSELIDHCHELKARSYLPYNVATLAARETTRGYIGPSVYVVRSLMTYLDNEKGEEDKEREQAIKRI